MFDNIKLSKEEIEMYKSIDFDKLKNLNIKEVKKEDLVDIRNIDIDVNLPQELKILQFIKMIKNPYFFKVGDVVVNTIYNDTDNKMSIEDYISIKFMN